MRDLREHATPRWITALAPNPPYESGVVRRSVGLSLPGGIYPTAAAMPSRECK
jgi:hypothetical protein